MYLFIQLSCLFQFQGFRGKEGVSDQLIYMYIEWWKQCLLAAAAAETKNNMDCSIRLCLYLLLVYFF